MKKILFGILAMLCCTLYAADKDRHTFAIQNGQFLYDGKPTPIYSGEMHYERVPAQYWRHRLRMMKAMGDRKSTRLNSSHRL